MTPNNLADMFFAQAARMGNRPRYRYRSEAGWREVSWAQCRERVQDLAAGLCALGLTPGATVALLSSTRPEWTEIDLGILAAGGVTVPIYPSNLAAECGYIVCNAEARIVFVENEKQLAKIIEVRDRGFELDGVRHQATVRHVCLIDGPGGGDVVALADLMARGRAERERHQPELQRRRAALGRDALATIVYTSGTTGPPKGVMQTHGNHLAAVEQLMRLGLIAEGEVDFFFLPLAHSFARLLEYLGLYAGTVTAFARSIDTLIEDAAAAQPHVIPAVPRVYEKIYARIQATRNSASPRKRRLLDWAFQVGRRHSQCLQQGRAVSPLLALQVAVAHRLVFRRIHALLGGRLRYLISGGAPLAREIAEFFHSIGLLVLEGYGLTETTPILTVNRPGAFKFGTVGQALDDVVLRIAEDGEVLATGPNIAQGYFRRPEATAETWDAQGWFHTGDIGELDGDGFLRITDRKKDLIKTSGGKYVAPQTVENLLKTQPHISQAVVIGDNRKYCVALITLDAEEIQSWARAQRVDLPAREHWPAHPEIMALIDREVAAVNQQLPSYGTIKYHRILAHDFSPESGELTPSLKVKRKVVAQRYQPLIEEMY
ncbi:MAG: long-chain fatty acid--CoA ligase [Deltaproteobacteria bacterium]|nr:long-chain fatty acid--CoA ligase [Deltaproteobacteria bacterium]